MTIFLLFDLKRKIYYLIFEKIMGKPHPSVRRHRLLKAPGHVISSVVATSSLQATTNTNSAVQKSVKSQASSGVDIDDDADAVASMVEAFNATSTSSNTELEDEEEDEQQQRFVGKS